LLSPRRRDKQDFVGVSDYQSPVLIVPESGTSSDWVEELSPAMMIISDKPMSELKGGPIKVNLDGRNAFIQFINKYITPDQGIEPAWILYGSYS
jgi:hypothetical protein